MKTQIKELITYLVEAGIDPEIDFDLDVPVLPIDIEELDDAQEQYEEQLYKLYSI